MKKVKLPFWLCYELDEHLATSEEVKSFGWTEDERLEHVLLWALGDFRKWLEVSKNKKLFSQAIKNGYEEAEDLDPEDNVLKVYLTARDNSDPSTKE